MGSEYRVQQLWVTTGLAHVLVQNENFLYERPLIIPWTVPAPSELEDSTQYISGNMLNASHLHISKYSGTLIVVFG